MLNQCPDLGPILHDVREVSGYLWERGWAERNAGNLSIDVTELVAPLADRVAQDATRWCLPPGRFPHTCGRRSSRAHRGCAL